MTTETVFSQVFELKFSWVRHNWVTIMSIDIDVLSLNFGRCLSWEVKTGVCDTEIFDDIILAENKRFTHMCVWAQGALSEVALFSHLLIRTKLHGCCATFNFLVHHLVLRVTGLSWVGSVCHLFVLIVALPLAGSLACCHQMSASWSTIVLFIRDCLSHSHSRHHALGRKMLLCIIVVSRLVIG